MKLTKQSWYNLRRVTRRIAKGNYSYLGGGISIVRFGCGAYIMFEYNTKIYMLFSISGRVLGLEEFISVLSFGEQEELLYHLDLFV